MKLIEDGFGDLASLEHAPPMIFKESGGVATQRDKVVAHRSENAGSDHEIEPVDGSTLARIIFDGPGVLHILSALHEAEEAFRSIKEDLFSIECATRSKAWVGIGPHPTRETAGRFLFGRAARERQERRCAEREEKERKA